MAIRLNCGSCQKTLNVKEEYAGKIAKCPQCGEAIKIPATSMTGLDQAKKLPVKPGNQTANFLSQKIANVDVELPRKPATASSDPSQLMREILAGFQGEFPRVTPTISYRLAAFFVATVMILLPLVYIALIGMMGYTLYWHATNNYTILTAVRGRHAGKAALLGYAGPLVIGGLLILFMIKPLFARAPKQHRELELSFTDEALLHSFVQRLCAAVNAPHPSLIEVDCEVNAAAYFRNGWWGFLRNDMVLRIGLPLMSALDTRQFAGILAHELGHFSQGAGMRLSYVIRTINGWFVRVIYERDEWDEWLVSCHDTDNGWGAIIAGLTSLFVWLTRRVLWCLMVIGHSVCCVLLRQMEYDADKYQARLAGSDVFESTMRRVTELSLADVLTKQVVASNYERAGLPDNLPLCLSKIARKLPPEFSSLTEKIIEGQNTGWFDSHPASRDRITAAHRQKALGAFQLERPAKVLLKDFNKLAENSTMRFYKQIMGKTAAKQQLTPTATFLAEIEFGKDQTT